LELGQVLASLPRPLYILVTLLLLEFVGVFAFTFIEPQMIFYFYDELGFTPTQFGLIVGGYGVAVVFGQTVLGRLSDRFGRKPMIVLGFSLNLLFYLSLIVVERFGLMFFVGVIAGLGVALAAPALNAYYLDLTTVAHRARVMGLKESAAALGGVAGPLLVAVVSSWFTAATVFLAAALVTLVAVLLILIVLPARGRQALPSPPLITNNFGRPAKYRSK
jgi:MFS family permease